MFYYFSIFKTHVNICSASISNNSSFHITTHHPGFAKTSFGGSTWVSNSSFSKPIIFFAFGNCSIFKTDINIIISTISNDSSLHATIHHSGFAKTVFSRSFNVSIDNRTFFKLAILSMFYNSVIFKTNIYISGIPISNNSGCHPTFHHTSFPKTVFSRSFDVLIGNIAFFKVPICLMHYYFSIFKTDINVIISTISNNCSFHAAVHHACFANSIYF